MVKTTTKTLSYYTLFIPVILLTFLIAYTQTEHYISISQELSPYILMDLIGLIPLVYFIIIRKTQIPNYTVLPVMILGMYLGSYILPADQQFYLSTIKKYGIPFIELTVLGIILFKVRKAMKTFSKLRGESNDFYAVLKMTCEELFPAKIAGLFVSEISVVYYGFLNWSSLNLRENEFSYHRRSGTPAVFGALIFIVAVETFAVHIVLQKWSITAAWILSILSVYTALQLLGFARSLSKRPIILSDDKLSLRYGILNEVEIEYNDIEFIELSRKALKYNDEVRKFSMLGDLESHNVVIHCNVVQTMKGIYGITKKFKTLALHIDDKDRFRDLLNDKISESKETE